MPIPNSADYPSPIVDIHAHYFPEPYLDLIEQHGAPFGAIYTETKRGPILQVGLLKVGPIGSCFVDLDTRLSIMNRQGVDIQALSLTQPMAYWPDEALSVDLSVAFNDALHSACSRHPERLVGLATLPMLYPQAALAELERVAALPGIHGIGMATTIGDCELSDRSFWPIYARIEELGLPIILHPLKVIGHERLEAHYFNNLLGNPFDTAVAAAHLIFDGVLDRFPRLEFSLPHAGGALPILMGRLDRGFAVSQSKGTASGVPQQPPSYYLRRFTYDTIAHSAQVIQYLVDLVGADRIMLGSDHCFDMGDHEPVRFVSGIESLNAEQRAQILSRTATRLLHLKVPL